MKKVTALLMALLATSAIAQVHVNGYVKKDGTYVAPTVRSTPNNSQLDNYSTKGNTNPITGMSERITQIRSNTRRRLSGKLQTRNRDMPR